MKLIKIHYKTTILAILTLKRCFCKGTAELLFWFSRVFICTLKKLLAIPASSPSFYFWTLKTVLQFFNATIYVNFTKVPRELRTVIVTLIDCTENFQVLWPFSAELLGLQNLCLGHDYYLFRIFNRKDACWSTWAWGSCFI